MTDKVPEVQPAPEEQSIDPSSVIIIHPGSKYLRIGRASDANPKLILNAIARRRRTERFKHADPIVTPRSTEANQGIIENCRNRLINQLQKSIRSDGRKRVVPSTKKIAEMNASQQPSVVTNGEEFRW